jgi:ssDNA-binding Zn-finger/Zn-ribbon topoisomerase 1
VEQFETYEAVTHHKVGCPACQKHEFTLEDRDDGSSGAVWDVRCPVCNAGVKFERKPGELKI